MEGSKLPKYATIKVLTAAKGVYRPQRFRYKDIIAAYNHPRAIRYIRNLASIPDYKITEADIRRIHFMVAEHLVVNPGQYRDHDVAIHDVFPLEFVIEHGYQVEMNDTQIKINPPIRHVYTW